MKELKSHPNLLLKEHIAQVRLAMEGIRQWHSEKTVSEEVKRLSELLAVLHDLGKGSDAFQEYIADPDAYTGDPREKAHSPLSLLLILLSAKENQSSSADTLILASAARGHHGALPNLPAKNFAEEDSSDTLDSFASGTSAKILKKQIASLDMPALENAVGIRFGSIGLTPGSVREAEKYLRKKVMPDFYAMADEDTAKGVDFRLKVQLVFSFLLEADKAFLAVPDSKAHLDRKPRKWKSAWVAQKIGEVKDNPVIRLRKNARTDVLKTINRNHENGIYSMTAPTGIGKTLLAASWALLRREEIHKQSGVPPKIIVVLPFLSIIDQTAREYRKLLETGGEEADGSWFLTAHSLSDRKYAPAMEEKAEHFFIDTWRTELVITTYDQFMMSLLDPRARYQMRFHNLCDALIIMDEVQSLPCKLWQLLNAALHGLVRTGNSQILLMSATLPAFVSETVPLLQNYEDYFKAFSRYVLLLNIREKTPIKDFCENMAARLPEWVNQKERVLITLNTRKSARMVYDCLKEYLKEHFPETADDVPMFFISADVTPKDRLMKIERIKEGCPCIVVSTQCIEAGVDIDMTRVIRDFGPWDSIVQIAGRCNREGKRSKWLPVEIFDIVNEKGRRFSEIIYDDVALQVTRSLTESCSEIREEDVLSLSERYFKELDSRKDTGSEHLSCFIHWREDVSVKTLLRGKDREKHSFLVIEQDPSLKGEMAQTMDINDRWERREAWRRLAGRIAGISVEVYARPGFYPEEIARRFAGNWILKEDYYDVDRGIMPEHESYDSDGFTVMF